MHKLLTTAALLAMLPCASIAEPAVGFGLTFKFGKEEADPGLALRVQTPHPESAVQVGRIDRGEPALRVDVLDAGPNVERVVVLLGLLVGVERLAVTEGPLTFGATLGGTRSACRPTPTRPSRPSC